MSNIPEKLDLSSKFWKDPKWKDAKVTFMDEEPIVKHFHKIEMPSWRDIPLCKTLKQFERHKSFMMSSTQYEEGYRHYFDLWVWTLDENKADYLRMAQFFEWAAQEARSIEAKFRKMSERYTKQVNAAASDILKYGKAYMELPNTDDYIDQMAVLSKGVNTETDSGDTPDDDSGLAS